LISRFNLLFYGIVILLIAITLAVFGFIFAVLGGGYGHRGPPEYSIGSSKFIDETLTPYVNLTITSGGGSGGLQYSNGTVFWIGSPQASVQYIENIHLLMYTRLESNETITKHIEKRVGVYPNEIQLPTGIIDYDEIIIPRIGLDSENYHFSLCCSYIIE